MVVMKSKNNSRTRWLQCLAYEKSLHDVVFQRFRIVNCWNCRSPADSNQNHSCSRSCTSSCDSKTRNNSFNSMEYNYQTCLKNFQEMECIPCKPLLNNCWFVNLVIKRVRVIEIVGNGNHCWSF
jgi:hypothetical protein